jgi:pimeloyl-ACP methyl ester carboxylesterase
VTVDTRGHGESGSNFAGPHTVAACAEDLQRLFSSGAIRGPPEVLIAHSFSGKVALHYALNAPATLLPKDVWILDTVPGPFDLSNDRHNSAQSGYLGYCSIQICRLVLTNLPAMI